MRMVRSIVVLFGTGGLLASPASAQLCPPAANPCVVTSNLSVPSGSVFNLGARDLVVLANKVITVQNQGVLTILARDITLQSGAKINANGTNGFGGEVLLSATGDIDLGTSTRIDVSAAAAGSIDLLANDIVANGQLRANSTIRDDDGGLVTIQASGNLSIAGTGINANGGDRFGCGGLVDLIADGNIMVSATVEVKGGDCDGGDIDFDALGAVTTTAAAVLNSIATYEFGSGGAVTIVGGTSVTVGGDVLARGSGSLIEGGGDGGDFDVIADGGDAVITGRVELTGAGPDGSGGFLDVFATGLVRISSSGILLTGAHEGGGGDLLIDGGSVRIEAPVDLKAGFVGGSFDVSTAGLLTLTAGGDIDTSATGTAFGKIGGTIDVTACDIVMLAGSSLLTLGDGPSPRATIRMRASNTMTIGGTLRAGALVELRYRTVPPVFVPGFVVSPAPVLVQDSNLPCCFACPVTTTTTIPVTTTTFVPGSSTTTVTTSTSSTTSTIFVPCGPLPQAGCRSPAEAFKSKIIIKDKSSDTGDKIVWKWIRGQATSVGDFGDPMNSDDYQLCLYDESGVTPVRVARADAPAGGQCGGKPCWRPTKAGYKYVDDELSPNGVKKVVMKSGGEGKAKIVLKAKGQSLDVPVLPVGLPMRAQLQGAGRCWEMTFGAEGVSRNTSDVFEAKATLVNTTTTTSTSSTSTTSPVPICGNGAIEAGEQCDDGNLLPGDCCSATCTAEPAGGSCADDGNVCTADVCDGAGSCSHPPGNGGTLCRPATDGCDAPETCSGASTVCPPDAKEPDGTACSEDACFTGQTCSSGVCTSGAPVICPACEACDSDLGCLADPEPACREPFVSGRSSLVLKDKSPDTADKVIWKWVKGQTTVLADFGDPSSAGDYQLCVFDESGARPTVLLRATAHAGGTCAGSVCWKATSSGFKYVDRENSPHGLNKIVLKAGGDGGAKVVLKGKGELLDMPAMPVGTPVLVQLSGGTTCWEATYSDAGLAKNDGTLFKGKSD
jgi:cysteine-rich repeat protein